MTWRILPTKHHLHMKHNLGPKCFVVFGSIFLKGKNRITFGIRQGNYLMKRTGSRAAQTPAHSVTDSALQQSCPCWQGTLSRPGDSGSIHNSCQQMVLLGRTAAIQRDHWIHWLHVEDHHFFIPPSLSFYP